MRKSGFHKEVDGLFLIPPFQGLWRQNSRDLRIKNREKLIAGNLKNILKKKKLNDLS